MSEQTQAQTRTTLTERRIYVRSGTVPNSKIMAIQITREDLEARQNLRAAGFRWDVSRQEWTLLVRTASPEDYRVLRANYQQLIAAGFRFATDDLAGSALDTVRLARHLTHVGLDWHKVPIDAHVGVFGGDAQGWMPVNQTTLEQRIAGEQNWPALGKGLRG